MFLNQYQPFAYDSKGNIRSNYLESLWKTNTFETLEENVKKVYKSRLTGKEIAYLSTEASILDTLMIMKKFENVLIVSTYDNENVRLTTEEYTPVRSYGHHFLPIIHKLNGSEYGLYVANTNTSENMFTKLYDVYGVNKINISDGYVLDNDKVKIDSSVKFDAIILINAKSMKKGKYQAKNVKKAFAPYGTEDFVLIDLFGGSERTLQPTKNTTEDTFSKIASIHRSNDKFYNNILNQLKQVCKVY